MKESTQREIFDRWLEAHRALLFKVIRSYAFDEEDRDDLFQDVCLQVYRSIPNYKGSAAVTTWLYCIALNTAIKWSTKEKKRSLGHQKLVHSVHILTANEDESDDRIKWLYNQIRTLNEVDRSITLLLLEGYSYKEMADILGISDSNLGVKIHRIKKQLTEKSKSYEYGT